MIAKALRNSEKYWEAFADTIEPVALAVENVTNFPMKSFLLDPKCFDHVASMKEGLVLDDMEGEIHHALWDHDANVKFLRERWWSGLDDAVRDNCLKYLSAAQTTEETEGTEDEALYSSVLG